MSPLPRYRETLTGAARPRIGLFGRVVMQVEVRIDSLDPWPRAPLMPQLSGESTENFNRRAAVHAIERGFPPDAVATWTDWRDARASDFVLATPDLRPLQLSVAR